MKYDYVNNILNKGFQMPKDESDYDESMMLDIRDHRKQELISMIQYLLSDFSILGFKDNTMILEDAELAGYFLEIANRELKFYNVKPEATVSRDKDFYLFENHTGDYVLGRVFSSANGVIISEFVLAEPKSRRPNKMIITGYNKMAVDKLGLASSTSIIDLEDAFSKSGMTPDFKREITMTDKSTGLKIQEVEVTTNPKIRFPEVEIEHYGDVTEFLVLESFRRARNYNEELRKLNGFPVNLEEKFKNSLQKH